MRDVIGIIIFLAFVLAACLRDRESHRSMLYHATLLFAGLLSRIAGLMLAFVSGVESVAQAVPRAFKDGWMAERFMERMTLDEVEEQIRLHARDVVLQRVSRSPK